MIGLQSNKLIKEKESRLLMSAKPYTIETLLVGKYYRSHSRHDEGVVVHAEKRDDVWYGENFEAYVVQVSPTRGLKDFWATVAVKIGE
jgi:hypothetical protein